MTEADEAPIRGSHAPGYAPGEFRKNRCLTCSETWPCPTASLLVTLDHARQRAEAAEGRVEELGHKWVTACDKAHNYECERDALHTEVATLREENDKLAAGPPWEVFAQRDRLRTEVATLTARLRELEADGPDHLTPTERRLVEAALSKAEGMRIERDTARADLARAREELGTAQHFHIHEVSVLKANLATTQAALEEARDLLRELTALAKHQHILTYSHERRLDKALAAAPRQETTR